MRRVALAVALVLVPAATAGAELGPTGPFPDRPCNLAARMNIYIGPDGTLWECVCEALTQGHVCDWYDQGKVSGEEMRRYGLRRGKVIRPTALLLRRIATGQLQLMRVVVGVRA